MGLHDQETVPLSHSGGSLGMALREIKAPRQLGSVRLLQEIGKGGMGVVWLGHDDMLGRDVAVKFLLGAIASDDDPNFATFLEGARAAAKLKCAGMTAVFHADVVEGSPYIVMEYVDGPTVSRVVNRTGALSLPAALAVMTSVCSTVSELHDAGIVHRDIKPSNVMLDTDCHVFLTDFGIAVSRPPGEAAEKCALAGTPAYMAPEAFEGVASPRTDTYALGMMLYEILTDSLPFEGTLNEVRDMHKNRELPLAPLHERQIEPAIVEIIQRATHKDPKFRYKSARHLLEALERAPLVRSIRQRAESELRSAALKCRTSGLTDSGHESTSGDISPRSLYDHLSTLAAKKRSETPTPLPARDPESSLGSMDVPLAEPGAQPRAETDPRESRRFPELRHFSCAKCGAKFSALEATSECPSCGAMVVGPSSPAAARTTDEEEPLRPLTVAWIGVGIFVVILIAIVAFAIAKRFT